MTAKQAYEAMSFENMPPVPPDSEEDKKFIERLQMLYPPPANEEELREIERVRAEKWVIPDNLARTRFGKYASDGLGLQRLHEKMLEFLDKNVPEYAAKDRREIEKIKDRVYAGETVGREYNYNSMVFKDDALDVMWRMLEDAAPEDRYFGYNEKGNIGFYKSLPQDLELGDEAGPSNMFVQVKYSVPEKSEFTTGNNDTLVLSAASDIKTIKYMDGWQAYVLDMLPKLPAYNLVFLTMLATLGITSSLGVAFYYLWKAIF